MVIEKHNPDLNDILEYVERRRSESENVPAENVERIFEMLQQATDDLLNSLPEKTANAITGCSSEKEIARLLHGSFKQFFADLDSQTKQSAGNDWDSIEIQRAFSLGLLGKTDIECSDGGYPFAWLAHHAKHSSENEYREAMRHMAIELLISGEQLSQAVRLWIAYILVGIDVCLHEKKGRPNETRRRLARQNKLAAFIIEDEKTNPRCGITNRLERAASSLAAAYSTVRNDYYKSSEFKGTLVLLRQRN